MLEVEPRGTLHRVVGVGRGEVIADTVGGDGHEAQLGRLRDGEREQTDQGGKVGAVNVARKGGEKQKQKIFTSRTKCVCKMDALNKS